MVTMPPSFGANPFATNGDDGFSQLGYFDAERAIPIIIYNFAIHNVITPSHVG